MKKSLSGILVVLVMMVGIAPAAAKTIGYADAMGILVKSCGKDIEQYCKDVRLGDNRIQNCLATNADKVSATCKADYARAYLLLQERFAAQESAGKICAGDAKRLCPGVTRGKGYVLQCLLNKRNLSRACSQIITDAGYRE